MAYDAIIIGGGPAGATAGLMLARMGWSVALVEKKQFPRRKVCGEFISATSMPLLRDLGLADVYLAEAGPEVRRVGLFAGDTITSAPMPNAWHSEGRWGRALGREKLDAVLLEKAGASGARIFQPWSAVALSRVDRGCVCRIAREDAEEELRGRIVIAAHGSWEPGPAQNRISRSHAPSDLLAFKALFRDTNLPEDLMPLLVFSGGYGGMVHTDGGRTSISCCIRRDVLREARARHPSENAGLSVFQHIVNENRGAREALSGATLEGTWLGAGPIRPGIRGGYRDGIFYAGNLAGEAHPIIAEGISMAMQSAWLLCTSLADCNGPLDNDGAIEAAGRRYAALWQHAFGRRLRAAAVFAHLTMRRRAAAIWVPVFNRYPELLTWAARLSGKAVQVVPTSYSGLDPKQGGLESTRHQKS
jgi:flavin-dependent dehydrogenase